MTYEMFLEEKFDELYEHFQRIKDLFMEVIWDKPVGLFLYDPAAVFTNDWKQGAAIHWESVSLIRKELKTKKPPNKYKECHNYLLQSLDYFQQAKEYAAKSYENENKDRNVNIDFNALGMAFHLINQGTGLLKKAMQPLIDEETS